MNYVALHMDVEFVAGIVCADNGTSYPVTTKSKEKLLWLYFHNNPHQNAVSFGNANKVHFNNSEVNYYGKLFEQIEREIETFTLRGIEHPVIDLLKESGLLETIRNTYQQKTLDATDKIPALLTFSSSIGDNAKQKTVDYLKKHGFRIVSYTIPIAELTCYHALNRKSLKIANGSTAVFMEASNSVLHLIKLSLADNYFLKDGRTSSYKGKGLDPRKRALAKFVVNEINKTTGVLSSEDEKEEEIERIESFADEWLKRLDAKSSNTPLNIHSVSFAKTPNMKRQIFVLKNDLDSDTGQYTQDLKDIYEAFVDENVRGNVAVVFLLGNCFRSDRVKKGFEQMIGPDRLHFYTNEDIHDVLSMYPKVDINRYASEESRIRERAKAEEQKQAEQRAAEAAARKREADEQQRLVEAQKAEQNRKEAQRLFDRAVELYKEGKWGDAKVHAENALSLDENNKEYKRFYFDLKEEIERLNAKNELYKSYLNNANKYLENKEPGKALEEYEAARSVFDNAEIIKKIIEVKRQIDHIKRQEENLSRLLSEVQLLIDQNDFSQAKKKINEILLIDKDNSKAQSQLSKIEQIIRQQEKQRQEAENRTKFEKTCNVADKHFQSGKWEESKQQYEEALKLYPNDKAVQGKIRQCSDKIKEIENAYKELLSKATKAESSKKWSEALELLNKAQQMRPDSEVKKRIGKIKFNLEFEKDGTSHPKPPTKDVFQQSNKGKVKREDFWEKKTSDVAKKEEIDDFLGGSKKKKTEEKAKGNKDDFDDFLRKK
jgi:tetratricopeptide (TPR) repeat protein